MFNKCAEDPWTQTFGDSILSKTIRNGVYAGGALFALGAVARAMEQYRVKDKPYFGVDVERAVSAASGDAAMSPDVLKKLKVEEQAKQKKEASLLSKIAENEEEDKFDPNSLWMWAVPVATGTLGGLLGAKMMDREYDKETAAMLAEDKARLASLHKKLVAARALNARGQLDDSVFNSLMQEAKPLLAKTAKMNKNANLNAVLAAAGLLMTASFALSAYGSYNYFKARNQNNLKEKALKKGLREYALANSMMKPFNQPLASGEENLKLINEMSGKKKKDDPEVSSTPMDYAAVTI